ncbi:MAG: hypothetical protein RRY97_09265, partial [Oscillibacter sp.]
LAYLRTMNPERAARESGGGDGYALLENQAVRERLEKMRETVSSQILREDAVRRLAELAFGRANDAARLALCRGETDPEGLDLSAVAELKVTDKGGVEIKFIDRIRALEALSAALEDGGNPGTEELLRALAEAAEFPAEGSGDND